MKLHLYLGLCVATISCTGCASIVSGTKQKISIDSNPPGATVVVDNAVATDCVTKQPAVTPAKVVFRRSKPHTVVLSLTGYDDVSVMLHQGSEPWVWGNLGFGGIIGILIDMGDGAAFRLKPRHVDVTLDPVAPPPSATATNTPPPADTGVAPPPSATATNTPPPADTGAVPAPPEQK